MPLYPFLTLIPRLSGLPLFSIGKGNPSWEEASPFLSPSIIPLALSRDIELYAQVEAVELVILIYIPSSSSFHISLLPIPRCAFRHLTRLLVSLTHTFIMQTFDHRFLAFPHDHFRLLFTLNSSPVIRKRDSRERVEKCNEQRLRLDPREFPRMNSKQHCNRCGKQVYPTDKVGPLKDATFFHQGNRKMHLYNYQILKLLGCFKCYICGTRLALKTYCNNRNDINDKEVYCSNHVPIAGPHDLPLASSNGNGKHLENNNHVKNGNWM